VHRRAHPRLIVVTLKCPCVADPLSKYFLGDPPTFLSNLLRGFNPPTKFSQNAFGAGILSKIAVDAGCVEAFLAAALTRVMRAAVPIPDVADASVSPSAAVGGSVVGVVGLL